MHKGQALTDSQVREILRKEMGSKKTQFGIRAIRRLFATYLIEEKKTNPRKLKEYAHKMGTSVDMLMSNYVQIEDDDSDDEYIGLGDMYNDESELETKTKKRVYKQPDEYKQRKKLREQSEDYKLKRITRDAIKSAKK